MMWILCETFMISSLWVKASVSSVGLAEEEDMIYFIEEYRKIFCNRALNQLNKGAAIQWTKATSLGLLLRQ
jgi:hypothetical protein